MVTFSNQNDIKDYCYILDNLFSNLYKCYLQKTLNEYEKVASIILFGCRCFLGHINMSTAALGQCIVDIFVNQNVDNIQRIRRHNSYHKSSIVPKSITASSRNFNPGVVLALEQVILRNHSGIISKLDKIINISIIFFKVAYNAMAKFSLEAQEKLYTQL